MSERKNKIFGVREPTDSLRLESSHLTFFESVIASICLVTYDYLTDYFKDLYKDWQTRRQFRERQIQFIVENPTPSVKSTLSIHGSLEELKRTHSVNPFIRHRELYLTHFYLENSLFSLNNPERAAFGRILKSRRP